MSTFLASISPNFHVARFGTLRVWFSYETPVAFQRHGNPIFVSENLWGPTTGRHIESISGWRSVPFTRGVFVEALDAEVEGALAAPAPERQRDPERDGALDTVVAWYFDLDEDLTADEVRSAFTTLHDRRRVEVP